MTRVGLLLQEQVRSALPPVFRRKQGTSNLWGTLLTLALVAGILAIFVLLFERFVGTYLGVRINRIPDVPSRQFELMTLVYFVCAKLLLANSKPEMSVNSFFIRFLLLMVYYNKVSNNCLNVVGAKLKDFHIIVFWVCFICFLLCVMA